MATGQRTPNHASGELIATLRRVPLFADLSGAEVAVIAGQATVRQYTSGAIIFEEGDSCRELLIVKEGSVRVFKSSPGGRRQLLAMERAGNSLSEVAVFDSGVHPATAEAASATVLICIDAGLFRKACLQNPDLALKVIKVLGYRLRRMAELIEQLSFSTVRARLISYLLQLAREKGKRTAAGTEIEWTENNEQLAQRLGTVRELVSRNLGRLHNQGLVVLRRRRATIPDLEALKEQISD